MEVLPRFEQLGLITRRGVVTETEFEGTDDLDDPNWPRFVETTYDDLGRIDTERRPGYSADPEQSASIVTVHSYNPPGSLGSGARLASVETRLDSEAGALLSAPTLYEYDDLGQVVRQGLDMLDGESRDGQLLPGSRDRITESETYYDDQDFNDEWSRKTVTTVYETDDSVQDKIVTIQSERLTGYTYGTGPTTTSESRTETQYYRGGSLQASHATSTITTTNRGLKRVLQTTNVPGSDTDAFANTRNGLLRRTGSPTGVMIIYEYDDVGHRVSEMDPRTGLATVTEYDPTTGRVLSVTNGHGDSTTYGYDPLTGRVTQVGQERDDGGYNYTYFKHNARGDVEKTWGDVPYPTRTEFDDFGQMWKLHTYREEHDWTQSSWPVGDVTTWNYDEATGLLESKEDATTNAVSYTYTTDGQLLTREWARGIITTYGYDPDTRELTSIDYDGLTPPEIEFARTRSGQPLTVADSRPDHPSYTYDYSGWPQQISETVSGPYAATITRTRDVTAGGRLSGITVGAEYAAGYEYDPVTGRLTRVTGPGLPNAGTEYGVYYDYHEDSDLVQRVSVRSAGTDLVRTTRVYESQRDLIDYVQNTWDPDGTPCPSGERA